MHEGRKVPISQMVLSEACLAYVAHSLSKVSKTSAMALYGASPVACVTFSWPARILAPRIEGRQAVCPRPIVFSGVIFIGLTLHPMRGFP